MTAPAPTETPQCHKPEDLRHIFCAGCVGFGPGIKVAKCGTTARALGVPVFTDSGERCVVCLDLHRLPFCTKCGAGL